MVQADPFAALLIQRGAGAFAGIATMLFFERLPRAAERFAPNPFQAWREQHVRCLEELSAAVADGLPQRFAQHVAWTSEGFTLRAGTDEELCASLECLRDVLVEELPHAAALGVGTYFEEALRWVRQPLRPSTRDELPKVEPARTLCIEYLRAIGAGDPAKAARLVLDAVRRGDLSLEQAIRDVLSPVQFELGRLWHRTEIGVGEEHLGTATTRRVLYQLLALAPTDAPAKKSVLVAVAAGDLHDIGAAIVAALFELDGWRVLPLGADLPGADLLGAAVSFEVDLVALSATLETQRRRIAEAILVLREGGCTLPVLVGGSAFMGDEATWRNAGADAFAEDATAAVQTGRRLVGLPARK